MLCDTGTFLFTGPFVMNTEEEIKAAMNDYRQGRNGFENAPKWNSSVKKGDK